jgi:hypothetical protein
MFCVAQKSLGERSNARRHGRREKGELALFGNSARIASMSSKKPSASISSASSNTQNETVSSVSEPRRK